MGTGLALGQIRPFAVVDPPDLSGAKRAFGKGKRMEIVLARHGKPKLDQWMWMSPRELKDWLQKYNTADIVNADAPSQTLARATRSEFIVSSPLLRCVQSTRLLAPSRDIHVEEVFREAGIPYALWGFPRLPLSVWAIIFRAAWFCGYSSNSEPLSLATIRARCAADRLIELARQHESVFVMGHGIMTALIAKQLLLKGWVGPKRPAHRYWQFSVYQFST
jgi:broad specificity phosphatase PhoE